MCLTLTVIRACRSHSILRECPLVTGEWGVGPSGFLYVHFENHVPSYVIGIWETKTSSTSRCLRKGVEYLCLSKENRVLIETVVSFLHYFIHLCTERFIHSRLLCSKHDSEVWECNNNDNRQHSCPLGTVGFDGGSSNESTLKYDGIRLGSKAVGIEQM